MNEQNKIRFHIKWINVAAADVLPDEDMESVKEGNDYSEKRKEGRQAGRQRDYHRCVINSCHTSTERHTVLTYSAV